MPCDTIQYTTLDASKMQTPLLERALRAMGFEIGAHQPGKYLQFHRAGQYGSFQNGKITVTQGFDEQRLQRLYSRELVKANAQRAGFAVREIDETHLEMYKRAG